MLLTCLLFLGQQFIYVWTYVLTSLFGWNLVVVNWLWSIAFSILSVCY